MSWHTTAAGRPADVTRKISEDLAQYPTKTMQAVAHLVERLAEELPADAYIEIQSSGHVDSTPGSNSYAKLELHTLRFVEPVAVEMAAPETDELVPALAAPTTG